MSAIRGTARRVLAAIIAPLVVASTAVAAIAITAPAADAYSGSNGLGCRLYFGDTGAGSSPSTYTDTFSLTLSPALPSAGATVTATFSASTGTLNGPVQLLPNTLSVVSVLDISGAQSATVTALTSASADTYPSAAAVAAHDSDSNGRIDANQPLGSFTTTGSFVASGSGPVTAALKQLKFDDGRFGSGSGANADTYCTDSSTALPGGVDPKAAPVVSTTIKQSVTVGGGATATPTPTPTSASATPTVTQTSATPTATTTSATPTATSATPTATQTSATPTATPTATGVASTLTCSTLGQNQAWAATWSASVTGTKVNVAFDKGPANGPVPLQSGWLKATADISAPSKVAVEGSPYGALAAREIIPGTTMTGTVSGTPTSIIVTKVVFKDIGSGSSVDTTCMPNAAITVPVASSPALPDTLPTATGDLAVSPTTVTAGVKITLSGPGFAPASNATAGMYSTPVALGVGTANAQGAISVDVTIPSGTTGSHTLILLGTDSSGGVVALTKAITVTAASTTPTPTDTSTSDPTDDPDNEGTLPQTGPGDFTMTLVWALVALQVGLIVAVRASRSRRPAMAGTHRR